MPRRTSCCPGYEASCACGRPPGFDGAPAGPPFQRLGFLEHGGPSASTCRTRPATGAASNPCVLATHARGSSASDTPSARRRPNSPPFRGDGTAVALPGAAATGRTARASAAEPASGTRKRPSSRQREPRGVGPPVRRRHPSRRWHRPTRRRIETVSACRPVPSSSHSCSPFADWPAAPPHRTARTPRRGRHVASRAYGGPAARGRTGPASAVRGSRPRASFRRPPVDGEQRPRLPGASSTPRSRRGVTGPAQRGDGATRAPGGGPPPRSRRRCGPQ